MATAAPASAELVLIGRSYCHLCDDMRRAVQPLAAARGLQLREVDVDAHPELESRWGEWVPVLLWHGREVCHYRFDPQAFHDALAADAGSAAPA